MYRDRRFAPGSCSTPLPLPSGNLEILARLDVRRRTAMLVPTAAVDDLIVVPDVTAVDFRLHIRILEFRLFFQSEDMLHSDDVFDVPGRLIPGPRLFYGVRWQFWN